MKDVLKNVSVFTLIVIFVFVLKRETNAQVLTQTLRGKVIDMVTEMPLIGAAVVLQNSEPQLGTITDATGEFILKNVPIGRQGIMVTYMGYNQVVMGNLILTSGKELVVEIKMEERIIETEEIVISAYARKDKPINEMASISARSFTVEETNRYAGTMGDPSRMASAYAGVNSGGDSRNDIIIRGNSPVGLLWKVDGITVPNPNHFGALGTTGGPVSILNNNLLTNSDFYTGAFPADYGNALSGAFDIRMRSGNNQKHEYIGQIGFNGFEFGVEGPFSKQSKSSFLASYRYSTLDVFDKLGIDLNIGGIPQYQDLTFKIDIPGNNYNKFSIFGIGGKSKIELLSSEEDEPKLFEDTYFGSDLGVVGLNHVFYINKDSKEASSIRTSLSVQGTSATTRLDTFTIEIIEKPFQRYGAKTTELIYGFNTEFRKKINKQNNISLGGSFDFYQFEYKDSVFFDNQYVKVTSADGDAGLLQAYFQWQHRFTEQLTLYTGLHYQYFNLSKDFSIEPRVNIKWDFLENKSLTIGYGLHSQIQPRMVYFLESRLKKQNEQGYDYFRTNEDLDFSKSHHLVVGYDWLISRGFRMKAEAYYQHLFNIPVERNPKYFSMLNIGDNYYIESRDSLVNKGKGRNMGVELTLEKFFSNNYYFLITTSLYDSQYEASDGKIRPTAFSGNYVANALAGYEFKLGKNKQHRLCFDFRAVISGGKRYVPIKVAESVVQGKTVFDEENAYNDRHSHYFRIDSRISFKMNDKKFNQEWGLDLQNMSMRKNVLLESFEKATGKIERQYQMGFMPMMLWRINF